MRLIDADEFKFEIGAKLAFTRLMGEEIAVKEIEAVDKPLTADGFKVGDIVKVVAQKSSHGFPIGEVIRLIESGHVPKWKAVAVNGKKYGRSEHWFVGEDEIETIIPTVKEVHRPAKVGEWIKVVDASNFLKNQYKNGDVIKVVEIDDGAVKFGTCGLYETIGNQEYNVLENYQSEEPKPMPSKDDIKPCNKVSRRAEVGEWVEITTDSTDGTYKIGDILQIVKSDRNKHMPYPYYKDAIGCYLEDGEYKVLENFNQNNLPSTEKPDISILDSFTFEDIAKYLFNKVGDAK